MERFQQEIYDIYVLSEQYKEDSIRVLTARMVLDSLPTDNIPLGLRVDRYKPRDLGVHNSFLFDRRYTGIYNLIYTRFYPGELAPIPDNRNQDPDTGEYQFSWTI